MTDLEKAIDSVLGPDRSVVDHADATRERYVAGYRLDTLSTQELLDLVKQVTDDAHNLRKRWLEATAARDLIVHYAWSGRPDVTRSLLARVVGNDLRISSIVGNARRRMAKSASSGMKWADEKSDTPLRTSPPWATGTPLDNAMHDLILFGGTG